MAAKTPRAYLKKEGVEEFKINHILNITIVDDFLNKRKIKANPPSLYMDRFNKTNSNLEATMSTHLIGDLEEFGIWDNDYSRFLKARALEFSRELEKRVIQEDQALNPNISAPDIFTDKESFIGKDDKINKGLDTEYLEMDFHKDMISIYEKADKECNYRPTRFLQMLSKHGGIKTAKTLIKTPGGTDGFTRLWELGRLDLSVEALVIRDKYRDLFSQDEINKCRSILMEYKYF